jgi:hypothetical protein
VHHGPAPEGVSSRVATQQPDGAGAGLPFKVHAHMLRHACGYALAMRGTTRGQFKTGSGIARSSTRSDTPSYRRRASENLGETSSGPGGPAGFCKPGSPFSPAGPYGPAIPVNQCRWKGSDLTTAMVVQHHVTYDGIGTSPTSFGIL